ncbi:MAG TPA: endospore germination permease [Clostridia bacterium]|nr:endospore germination permease [Clostridia bacterium]
MIDSGKISPRQLVFLLVILIVSTELLFLPGFIVQEAAEGAWLSISLGGLFGAAVVLVVSALGNRFPDKSIVQFPELIIGKVWGKIIGFLLVTYAFVSSSIVLREFYELLESSSMPETPPTVFAVSLIIVAALAVRAGIEVIARNGELYFMLAFLITVFLLVLLVKDLRLENLLPVFGEGYIPVVRGSVHAAGFMGEVVLLAFLIPNLNRPKEAAKAGLWAVLVTTITLVIVTGFTQGVFGSEITANTIFPALALGRFISIANFLEHLDAFFLVYWVVTVFIKLSLFYYVAVIGTSQLTGLKEYKALVLPIAVIINTFSFVFFRNTIELLDWLSTAWGPYAITIEFIIPLFLLTIVIFREKKPGAVEN